MNLDVAYYQQTCRGEAQYTRAKSKAQIREIYIKREWISNTYVNTPKSFKVQSYFQKVRIYQEKTENNEVKLQLGKIPTYQGEFNPWWLKPITK